MPGSARCTETGSSTVVGVDASNMTARALLERFTSAADDNFINYHNTDYDALFQQAQATADDAEQTELYKQMERNLTEHAANVYIQDLADLVAVRKGLEQAARDATVQVQADTHTQRAMWLMVCSIADAYGFGPKQLQKFFTALQDNTDELERMRTDVDEEYAFEKLRQKAQAVTGMEVHYLYEQEALLAEMQAAKEGVSAHE